MLTERPNDATIEALQQQAIRERQNREVEAREETTNQLKDLDWLADDGDEYEDDPDVMEED